MSFNIAQAKAEKVGPVLTFLNEPLNEDFVWEALQMAGDHVPVINGRRPTEGNKTLAGVGDRVACLIVVEDAYKAGKTIGQTNRDLQTQVNNSELASVLRANGLAECINKNPGHMGELPASTLSHTAEALIGAAYFSGGLGMAKRVMLKLGIIT